MKKPALPSGNRIDAGRPAPHRHPPLAHTRHKGRQWIDFQHDVTLKDIEVAARENYTSVEHLKRYTTLGMASDQGKTSNMAGLAAMAALKGATIPEVGTTTFRPPFVPIPLATYHGQGGPALPPDQTPETRTQHRAAQMPPCANTAAGSAPAGTAGDDRDANIAREARMAREPQASSTARPWARSRSWAPTPKPS